MIAMVCFTVNIKGKMRQFMAKGSRDSSSAQFVLIFLPSCFSEVMRKLKSKQDGNISRIALILTRKCPRTQSWIQVTPISQVKCPFCPSPFFKSSHIFSPYFLISLRISKLRAASCKKSTRKNKSIRKNKSTRKHILYLKMCFLLNLFFLIDLFFF